MDNSIPRDLYLGVGSILGLDVEDLNVFIFILMDLALPLFLKFSKKINFQSDEWKLYYYAVLEKFVVAMHKSDRPRKICRFEYRDKQC